MVNQNIKNFIDWKAKHGDFKHFDWSKPLSSRRKKNYPFKKKISLNFSNEDFFFKRDRYKEKLTDQNSFLYYFNRTYKNNMFYVFFYWKYIYQDYILSTLINFLMRNGEKNKTFSFFFKCLFLLKKKIGMNPIFLIKIALLKRNWMVQLTKKQFNKKVFFFTRILDFKQQICQCISKFLKSVNWLRIKKKIPFWKSFFLLILNHHIVEKKKKKKFFDFNRKIHKWILFFFKKLKFREMFLMKWRSCFFTLKIYLNLFQKIFLHFSYFYDLFFHFFNFSFHSFFKWINFLMVKFSFINWLKKRIFRILMDQKNDFFWYWFKLIINLNQYQTFFISLWRNGMNIFYSFYSFYSSFQHASIFQSFEHWNLTIWNWKKNFSIFFFFFLK